MLITSNHQFCKILKTYHITGRFVGSFSCGPIEVRMFARRKYTLMIGSFSAEPAMPNGSLSGVSVNREFPVGLCVAIKAIDVRNILEKVGIQVQWYIG